mgnify:CR=1 FL=1
MVRTSAPLLSVMVAILLILGKVPRKSKPRSLSLAICLIAILMASGCDSRPPSSPTGALEPGAPTAANLQLRAGVYLFALYGHNAVLDRTNGASVPGCPGVDLRSVGTLIEMEWTGTTWRGRPTTPAGGSFEMTIEPGPRFQDGPAYGPGVAGSLDGMAVNTHNVLLEPPGATHVTMAGARLVGDLMYSGSAATGQILGDVVFGTAEGETFPCNSGTVNWQLFAR